MKTALLLTLLGSSPRQMALNAAAREIAAGNPTALFFNGGDSDITGFAYQNATSLTPATGTDPVGVMLDRTYGSNNIGPDRVTNGTFAADANWIKGTGWTISGGELVATSVATSSNTQQVNALTVGKFYLCGGTVKTISNGALRFFAGGSTAGVDRTAPGTYQELLKCAGNGSVAIVANGAITAATVDDVIYREVLGYPARQATAGSKPTLLKNAAGYYDTVFDGTDDTFVVDLPSAGSPYVMGFSDTGEIVGAVSATTTAVTVGYPTWSGKKISLFAVSATEPSEQSKRAFRRYAGMLRGSVY